MSQSIEYLKKQLESKKEFPRLSIMSFLRRMKLHTDAFFMNASYVPMSAPMTEEQKDFIKKLLENAEKELDELSNKVGLEADLKAQV